MKRQFVFVAVTMTILASSLVLHASEIAVAGSAESCNPGRTNDYQYFRWDGFEYPNDYLPPGHSGGGPGIYGTPIYGVASYINSYVPYIDSGNPNNDGYSWVWVMLSNDLSNNVSDNYGQGSPAWAQVGPSTYTDGTEHISMEVQNVGEPQYNTEDPWASIQAGSHNFEAFVSNGSVSFYEDGSPLVDSNGLVVAQPITFIPTQAVVAGETHTNASQMYGDINTVMALSLAQFYVNGGWTDLDTNNQATIFNTGISAQDITTAHEWNYPSNPQFGYKVTPPTEDFIWDNGCPQSALGGDQVGTGHVLDASGSGNEKWIMSPSNTFDLVADPTNGTYTVQEMSDPNGGGKTKDLWQIPGYSSSDYLIVNPNENLVLWNAWGKNSLWTTATGGGCTQNCNSPYLTIQDDGNLVLYPYSGGTALWQAGTYWATNNSGLLYGDKLDEGQQLTAGGDHLNMQTDGNLVLYNSSGTALWYTGTDNTTGNGTIECPSGNTCTNYLIQQGGNLVEYMETDSGTVIGALWNAGTSGYTDNHMVLTGNGTFSVYTVTGDPHLGGAIWTSSSNNQ